MTTCILSICSCSHIALQESIEIALLTSGICKNKENSSKVSAVLMMSPGQHSPQK
jgi:hypothetical protein